MEMDTFFLKWILNKFYWYIILIHIIRIWIQNHKMDTKTLNGYSKFNGYQKHTMDTNYEYGYLHWFIIFHMDTLLLRWIIYVQKCCWIHNMSSGYLSVIFCFYWYYIFIMDTFMDTYKVIQNSIHKKYPEK